MDEMRQMLDRLSLLPPAEGGEAMFASLLSFASSHPGEGCRYGGDIASTSDRLFGGKKIPCPVAIFLSSFVLFSSSLVLLCLYIVLLPPSFQMACLLLTFFCLRFYSSGLARFIVGSLSGVRFLHFFPGTSTGQYGTGSRFPSDAILFITSAFEARIDYARFFCLSRQRRALTIASGTLASMLIPLFTLAVSWQIDTAGWVRAGILALSVGNISLTAFTSLCLGDLALALRQK